MVVKCELHFIDNPLGIYYAGQTVSGRVEIDVDKPKKIRGICLHVNGYARTNWSESDSATSLSIRKDINRKTYASEEEYFSYVIYLGTPPQDDGYILPVGLHSYDFSVDLPQDLPTSFEGMFGCIRYTIKAILERPWEFDLKYRLIFTVLKQSDLNYDSPDLRLPVKIEQTKYFWWWPCKSGPFWMSITLPITGFVPGQMIPIAIELDNESNVQIDKIDFKLQKIVKYTSTQPSERQKVERKLVVSKESTGVSAKDRKRLHHNLLIPSIPPSTTSLCSIIQVVYALEIKIVVPGIHNTDKLKIPITIGTVPLRLDNIIDIHTLFPPLQQDGSQVPQPNASQDSMELRSIQIDQLTVNHPGLLPTQPPRYSDINPMAEEFVNLPNPPSYEESVYGIVQVEPEDQDEQMESVQRRAYVPRYPVYSFCSPTAAVTTKPSSSQDVDEPTSTQL